MVFYRKYRPQKFSDLVGQNLVVDSLLSQLRSGKIGHAYLFSGPKGTGKTSTARILAKAVNCKKASGKNRSTLKFDEPCNKCISCTSIWENSHLDLIEIDAASNRNIDDVREIREKIKLAPVSGQFKVYIIDEVHMLTREAFNALLKTLEEPPEHAIFILCTTEINKLPQTIISRVQRFNFARASDEDLKKALSKIVKNEGIKISEEGIIAIVNISDGSYRDAVSILDQLAGGSRSIKKSDVNSISMVSNWNEIYYFVKNIAGGNTKESLTTIEKIKEVDGDFSYFTTRVIMFLEQLLNIKIGISERGVSADQLVKMQDLAQEFSMSELQILMKNLLVSEGEIKIYPLPHIPLLVAVTKYIVEVQGEVPAPQNDNQILKQAVLEEKIINKKEQKKSEFKEDKIVKVQSKTLSGIEKNWSAYLAKVKGINAHVMAVLRATKPIVFKNDILTLGVYYRFHKEKLEERKILLMLEEILSDMMSKKVRMKFVLEKKDEKLPKNIAKSDVIDVGESELEKLTQEIFSK